MIEAETFLGECLNKGIRSFTGTPCSYLKPFINQVIDHPDINFYPSTNEGDAVGFASGQWLGGKLSAVIFQNSGLGNAVNPITSLSQISKIPFLGIVTMRAEPGGESDEPQHQLMGRITTGMLDLMEIPWARFPENAEQAKAALEQAFHHMMEHRTPYFFTMSKGAIADYELKKTSLDVLPEHSCSYRNDRTGKQLSLTRSDALRLIHRALPSSVPIIATTGKAGRELFEIQDSERNFYMVGSMGCALSIGQGLNIALGRPVAVIDGDGALMMRLGSMTTNAIVQPPSLLHILLDNGAHDSTGGQSTGSERIQFSRIAEACRYDTIIEVDGLKGVESALGEFAMRPNRTMFLWIRIKTGGPKKLGRPTVTPEEVSLRLKNFLMND